MSRISGKPNYSYQNISNTNIYGVVEEDVVNTISDEFTAGTYDASVSTINASNGSVTDCSFGFVSRGGDTGLYLENPSVNDNIAVAVSGTKSLIFGDGQVLNIDGSIDDNGASSTSTPSISFLDDTQLGFYRVGSKSLGLALGVRQPVDVMGTSYLTFTDNNLLGSDIDISDGVNTLHMAHSDQSNYLTNTSAYVAGVNSSRAYLENSAASVRVYANSSTIDLRAPTSINMNINNSAVLDIDSTSSDFSIPITLPTTGGTASNLSYYEEYSASFTFSGSGISTSGTVKITRIGNMCVLQTPKMTGTANNTAASISSTTNLPTRFIPAATETIYSGGHICANNGTSGTGFWFAVSQTGTMSFSVVGGTNWNGTVALFIGSISYLV